MRATDLLTLPAGVLLRPADTIEETVRDRLHHSPGDFILTRPGSRTRSLLIDAAAANLLQLFQQPRTVVDAVIAISRRTGTDPERLLAEVLPLIGHLRERRLLVVAGSVEANEIEPTLKPSSTFGNFRVLECVHLFEDVEVYHVMDESGQYAALKVLRPDCDARAARSLDQEAAIIERLGGVHAPVLLERGEVAGRRFALTSWCAGRDVNEVAEMLRAASPSPRPPEVAQLCVRLLRAYARLHDMSVLHGDVHPGNIKVDSHGSVTILDFALSSCGTGNPALPPLGRGGIAEYVEPEYCRAMLLGKQSPPATALSEQYALASLCFLLLTGVHSVQFDFQRDRWMSQVIEDPPRSFFASGTASWPTVERVLARALCKDPADRFVGVSAFADELEKACQIRPRRIPMQSMRQQFVEHTTLRFGATRMGIPSHALRAPNGTVNSGAAGIAYLYYRLGGIRDDPKYLTTADLWSSWAEVQVDGRSELGGEKAQTDLAGGRPASLFRGHAGIHCVETLIRLSAGDNHAAALAAEKFVAACNQGNDINDIVFGRAGLLLGCAALIEALQAHFLVESRRSIRKQIVELGDRIAGASQTDTPGSLGFAHGRTGVVFGGLRWHEATGWKPPWLLAELEELADITLRTATTQYSQSAAAESSWCRGTAGRALLWNLADRCFPGGSFASMAEAAADSVWRERNTGSRNGSLCCGNAGQGYALLAHFRRTGDRRWLTRAEALCELAIMVAAKSRSRCSLYKGDIGVSLLALDLEAPLGSCMPLLEAESWRSI